MLNVVGTTPTQAAKVLFGWVADASGPTRLPGGVGLNDTDQRTSLGRMLINWSKGIFTRKSVVLPLSHAECREELFGGGPPAAEDEHIDAPSPCSEADAQGSNRRRLSQGISPRVSRARERLSVERGSSGSHESQSRRRLNDDAGYCTSESNDSNAPGVSRDSSDAAKKDGRFSFLNEDEDVDGSSDAGCSPERGAKARRLSSSPIQISNDNDGPRISCLDEDGGGKSEDEELNLPVRRASRAIGVANALEVIDLMSDSSDSGGERVEVDSCGACERKMETAALDRLEKASGFRCCPKCASAMSPKATSSKVKAEFADVEDDASDGERGEDARDCTVHEVPWFERMSKEATEREHLAMERARKREPEIWSSRELDESVRGGGAFDDDNDRDRGCVMASDDDDDRDRDRGMADARDRQARDVDQDGGCDYDADPSSVKRQRGKRRSKSEMMSLMTDDAKGAIRARGLTFWWTQLNEATDCPNYRCVVCKGFDASKSGWKNGLDVTRPTAFVQHEGSAGHKHSVESWDAAGNAKAGFKRTFVTDSESSSENNGAVNFEAGAASSTSQDGGLTAAAVPDLKARVLKGKPAVRLALQFGRKGKGGREFSATLETFDKCMQDILESEGLSGLKAKTAETKRDDATCKELQRMLSDFIDDDVRAKLKASPAFSVSCDETICVGGKSQFAVYVHFINVETWEKESVFLTICELANVDAESIKEILLEVICASEDLTPIFC